MPEVQRNEPKPEPIVLADVRELMSPPALGERGQADDDMPEGDRRVTASLQDQEREAAIADVLRDAARATWSGQRQQPDDVTDQVVDASGVQGSLSSAAWAADASASVKRSGSVTVGSYHTVTVQFSRSTRMRSTPGAICAFATTRGAHAGQSSAGTESVT